MSHEISGTLPQKTNEQNPQVDEHEPKPQRDTNPAPPLELTPDRPPQPVDQSAPKPRRPRGFAAMDRTLVSEIARKGGKAAHSAGTAHEFTSDEAREAGRKGGRATHAKRRKQVDESPEKA
jgi:general stress protein YciG